MKQAVPLIEQSGSPSLTLQGIRGYFRDLFPYKRSVDDSPSERTRSVLEALQLLMELAVVPHKADLEKYRVLSRRLLRHFPEPICLHLSASFASGIWADPDAKWRCMNISCLDC